MANEKTILLLPNRVFSTSMECESHFGQLQEVAASAHKECVSVAFFEGPEYIVKPKGISSLTR